MALAVVLPISPYISLYLAYISPTYRVALAVVLDLPISPCISLYLAYISPTYRVALAVVLELETLVLVRDEHVLRGPRLVRARVRDNP